MVLGNGLDIVVMKFPRAVPGISSFQINTYPVNLYSVTC